MGGDVFFGSAVSLYFSLQNLLDGVLLRSSVLCLHFSYRATFGALSLNLLAERLSALCLLSFESGWVGGDVLQSDLRCSAFNFSSREAFGSLFTFFRKWAGGGGFFLN